ncbi:MAG: NTP transferase domain-containing protein [Oliverpabstia sp.]
MTELKKRESPSIDEWLREAKADPRAADVGMFLVHNGTVRKTAKARVRMGEQDAQDVSGMLFSYDEEKVQAAIRETYRMEGIHYIRVWLNSGKLEVGDDIMYVLIGGDIRPHVVAGLEALVGKIKSECVKEKELYASENKKKVGCVIMASGLSKRFGRNKLLAEFRGKTMIQRILDITGEELFDRRVVVTRSEEVRELCRQQKVDVIFHELPDRNDTIHFGVDVMKEMDGCMFCPCDQPLLQRESLVRMLRQFEKKGKGIYRLSYEEKQGAPILFGKEYFQELLALPSKCGGSYLVKKYPDQVENVSASDKIELFDIDTPEQYEAMIQKYR